MLRLALDRPGHFLPHGGLLRADGAPKAAYQELLALREDLIGPAARKGMSVATGSAI